MLKSPAPSLLCDFLVCRCDSSSSFNAHLSDFFQLFFGVNGESDNLMQYQHNLRVNIHDLRNNAWSSNAVIIHPSLTITARGLIPFTISTSTSISLQISIAIEKRK